MTYKSQADILCGIVARSKDMTSATVRITAWLIGVAELTNGYPVEVSYRQVRDGLTIYGKTFAGTGSRLETIKLAFEWLGGRGYLTSENNSTKKAFGYAPRQYTLDLK